MKRIIALLLSLVLCFTFCACGGKQQDDGTQKGNGIDLNQVFTDGKIPEIAVFLGMSEEDVKTLHNYSADAEGETGFYISNEGDYTRYLTGVAEYYVKNDKSDKGISVIVCLETAFGLHCNTYEKPEDVKNAFPMVDFTESELNEDEKFFSTSAPGTTALSFTKDSRKISFIFLDEQLINVILVDTENWSELNA